MLLCLIILLWILVGLFGIMVLVARHFWSICSRGLEKSQRTAEAARSDGHSKTLQQDRTRFLLRNNNILLLCHQDSYVMEFQVLTRWLCLSKYVGLESVPWFLKAILVKRGICKVLLHFTFNCASVRSIICTFVEFLWFPNFKPEFQFVHLLLRTEKSYTESPCYAKVTLVGVKNTLLLFWILIGNINRQAVNFVIERFSKK